MMTTRWADRLRPHARLRDTTITWTSPRTNRCSTSLRSSSARPSWRYATPLLTVSLRVYRKHITDSVNHSLTGCHYNMSLLVHTTWHIGMFSYHYTWHWDWWPFTGKYTMPACSQPTMSTQPSALHEMVKWAFRRWWVDSQCNSVGFVWELVAAWYSDCIHHMN